MPSAAAVGDTDEVKALVDHHPGNIRTISMTLGTGQSQVATDKGALHFRCASSRQASSGVDTERTVSRHLVAADGATEQRRTTAVGGNGSSASPRAASAITVQRAVDERNRTPVVVNTAPVRPRSE